MSQLTVKLSDRADALIAQLQKEIFNRRRKKVSAAGVIETLVESGAKSQSDKRFATSWKNLVSDIEKAAKVADAHGAKPANLSDEEWALVLSHRTRTPRATGNAQAAAGRSKAASAKGAGRRAAAKPAAKAAAKSAAAKQPAKPAAKPAAKAAAKPAAKAAAKPAARKRSASVATRQAPAAPVATATGAAKSATRKPATRKPAARKPVTKSATSMSVSTKGASSSVARRMAKAVSRLGGAAAAAPASSNGAGKPVAV